MINDQEQAADNAWKWLIQLAEKHPLAVAAMSFACWVVMPVAGVQALAYIYPSLLDTGTGLLLVVAWILWWGAMGARLMTIPRPEDVRDDRVDNDARDAILDTINDDDVQRSHSHDHRHQRRER